MADDFVTVATFGTPVEAGLAKNRLEAEGIRAYLADEETVGWLWHLGNAVGGIKLQVVEADFERADAILAERHGEEFEPGQAVDSPDPRVDAQQCPRCGSAVAPESRECSTCGTDLVALEEDARSAVNDLPMQGESQGAEDEESATARGDELATRALKASIIGLLLCPPLLHVYSSCLLLRLAFYQGELGKVGIRHMYVAAAINALVFLVAAIVVHSLSLPTS